MATPRPGGPEPVASPTVRLEHAPALDRSSTDEPVAAPPPRPGHPDDESTIGLPRPTPNVRQRTIQFGTPAPVKVTVSARPRTRRRYRTWPWIAAVVVALLVLAVVLVVMLLQGSTLDGDTRLIGPGGSGLPGDPVTTTYAPAGDEPG